MPASKKQPTRPNGGMRARLQKEIASSCPFCNDGDVGHFEVHHIDSDPWNSAYINLVMVCRKCHSKMTKGEIPEETVRKKKALLQAKSGDVVSQESRMFTRGERELFEHAFIKLDQLINIDVEESHSYESGSNRRRNGTWDVKISFLELLMLGYYQNPRELRSEIDLDGQAFEMTSEDGEEVFFKIRPRWSSRNDGIRLEQLGFATQIRPSRYTREYTRTMHRFALWLDVNGMSPKSAEVKWNPRKLPIREEWE